MMWLSRFPLLQTVARILGWFFLLALIVAARCANHEDVLVGGQIYFVDADCYSRMTRVQKVLDQPGLIVRHHDFENYPQGIQPHTTAPLDYLIAAMAICLRPFTAQPVDLAGALVSPLLALATGLFLATWVKRLQLAGGGLLLLLFATSPILVHCGKLGRPDHQSLLLFCMAAGIGAEVAMLFRPSRGWGMISGLAWSLGLWVSLYEPAVLLATVVVLQLLVARPTLLRRERLPGLILFAAVAATALLLEGWRIQVPRGTEAAYFSRWQQTIGELAPAGFFSSLFFRWLGFGVIAAPFLLLWCGRKDRCALFFVGLCFLTYVLTVWQLRWGYFLGLCFVMAVPWLIRVFPNRTIGRAAFIITLWPLLQEWDESLFPEGARSEALARHRVDAVYLRAAAVHLRSVETLPFLAPWWLSPPIVYWSGQPAVAGSSHESLPGIIDAARFYLDDGTNEAMRILRERKVLRVFAYEPTRIASTAEALLGTSPSGMPLVKVLYTRPKAVPEALQLEYANDFFKIFSVEPGKLPP